MIGNEKPLDINKRNLKWSFTTTVANEGFKFQYIGRKEFGETFTNAGSEILKYS